MEHQIPGIFFTIADISKTVTIKVMRLGQYCVCFKTDSEYANEDDKVKVTASTSNDEK